MKKILPILLVLVLVGGAGWFVLAKADKKDNPASTTAGTTAGEPKKFSPPQACNIFTLDDAKKVLGDNAKTTEIPASNASSDDIEVTQCFYEEPSGDTLTSIKNQKQANILVRGAKTEQGESSNTDYFKGSTKPGGVEDISGYGDSAFWNPQFGQLNILKNGNWYILSVGPATPLEKKLDDAKALADILIGKL